jgi:hypothetical protein
MFYKLTREGVTTERMHRAFARGLMEYGMIRSVKKDPKKMVEIRLSDSPLLGASINTQ